MAYLLFLLANATLFIRPSELFPSVETVPIYLYLMLGCLAVSAPAVLARLTQPPLAEQPITVCVLGLWFAVILSHVSHFDLYSARMDAFNFIKPVLYYLLLVTLLNTPTRLRSFLKWLILFTAISTSLALLHFHGIINLPALEALQRRDFDESGEETFFLQLRSTGIFNDPNDLCLILTVGILVCLYFAGDPDSRQMRPVWLLPVGLFGYALALTRSRGGFIALLTGVLVFVFARFGRARSVLICVFLLPMMFLLFAGRSTDISTDDDTAQGRIQLWAEGTKLFRQAPIFGIGKGMFDEEVGHVAHNSFVHSFTELGFFGGTLFLGGFYIPFVKFRRLRSATDQINDSEMRRLLPCLMGLVAGYGAGLMSLSRSYVEPTYMVFGLAAAYFQEASVAAVVSVVRFDARFIGRLAWVSLLFMAGMYVFIRVFVNWG